MATNVRRIVAEISAKNKAKGVMAGFRGDLDKTGRALRRMATGVIALAGIGGLGYMIKKQMETIDATAKLSDRIGMATEHLVGLQYGAKIMGVETESLNKALEYFSKGLGEASKGIGESKYALDALGLSAEELVAKSPHEAIRTIADEMSKLKTQTEKTFAAQKLFGRSGIQMVNILQEGSSAIDKLQKEAEGLGLTFSRWDAAQVEAANDAFYRMRSVFTGLSRQVTIQLAPHLEVLATSFVNAATSGEGMGTHVVNAFEWMSLGAIKFTEQIDKIPYALKRAEAGMMDLKARNLEVLDSILKFKIVDKWLLEKTVGIDITFEAQKARQEAEFIRRLAEQSTGEFNKARTAVEAYFDSIKSKGAELRTTRFLEYWDEMTLRQLGQFPKIDLSMEAAKVDPKLEAGIESTISALERQVQALDMVNSGMAENVKIADFMIKAQDTYGEGTTEYEKAVKHYIELLNKLDETAKLSADGVAAAYRSMSGQMTLMTQEAYNVQIQALNKLRDQYIDSTKDRLTVDRWYYEQVQKLEITRLRASEDFFDGVKAASQQMQMEMMSVGEMSYKIALSMRDSFGDAMYNMIAEGRNFRDAMTGFLADVGRYMARLASMQVANAIWSSVIGGIAGGVTGGSSIVKVNAGVAPAEAVIQGTPLEGATFIHEGGIVGKSMSKMAKVPMPAELFAGAPKFALGTDEFPAILHKNEHVLTPPQMNALVGLAAAPNEKKSGDVIINLHYTSLEPLQVTKSEQYLLSDKRIIEVWLDSLSRNGSVRGAIRETVAQM